MNNGSNDHGSPRMSMLPFEIAGPWAADEYGPNGVLVAGEHRILSSQTQCRWWCSPWRFGRRPRAARFFIYLAVAFLSTMGIVDLVERVLPTLRPYVPSDVDWLHHPWDSAMDDTDLSHPWFTDAAADIRPVNCHSHNDYWRRPPLYAAIKTGCVGVEADIWLVGGEVYVGHRRFSLRSNRTLRNLYVSPLLELLEKQNSAGRFLESSDSYLDPHMAPFNGVFDADPSQMLVLLVDFKSSSTELWRRLNSELTPLRERGYLTHFNGTGIVKRPIAVVGTGNAPFDSLVANETYRDVFFDAPLDDLADLSAHWPNPNRAQDPTRSQKPNRIRELLSKFNLSDAQPVPPRSNIGALNATAAENHDRDSDLINAETYGPYNSYYASVSFTKSIGRIWGSRLTQAQLQLIRGQVRGAHQRGLKVRYWGIPSWPRGLRNHVWHILMREGVDILNVDDLYDATQTDWRRQRSWNY